MEVEFNADEVFDLAQRIEKRGSAFYRQAALASRDQASRSLFASLAQMEDDHDHIFGAMRERLARHRLRPQRPAQARWEGVANMLLTRIDEDLSERFAGMSSVRQILMEAIEFEKDTIVFLLAMKDMIPDAADKSQIDTIIKEELGHVVSLGSQLATGKGS